MILLQAFSLGAALSFLLCFPVRECLSRWKVVDLPNNRSSHGRPTVRGGGIAILAAAFVAGVSFLPGKGVGVPAWVAASAAALAVVSFIDDVRSLPQSLRFGVQALSALTFLAALSLCDSQGASISAQLTWMALGFTWITGYTNAFNFMDGINGLAGLQLVVTGVGTALIGIRAGALPTNSAVVISIVLAGAGLGFLPHNFPRAKMFLGDVGSAPIGFLLAAIAFWLARDFGWWLLGAFGLIHANFVADTALTLARRFSKGERWSEPHREHYYQKLVRSGKSHEFVTGMEVLAQFIVIIVVLAAEPRNWIIRGASVFIVGAIWWAFFAYAQYEFDRAAPPEQRTA